MASLRRYHGRQGEGSGGAHDAATRAAKSEPGGFALTSRGRCGAVDVVEEVVEVRNGAGGQEADGMFA